MLRLKRHIVTEVLEIFLAVIVALILIMVSFQFTKLLNEAASGKIVGSAIYHLVALQTVKLFVLLTPFAFFIAMLIGLTRLANDNELIAMRSVGYGDYHTYSALYALAIPLALLTAFMTLQVLPKVLSLNYQLLDKAKEQSELSIIQPGQFRNIGNDTTLFVSDVDDSAFSQFFVWQRTKDGQSITVAQHGEQTNNDGERYLNLHKGSRYTHNRDNSSHIMTFETLSALLPAIESTRHSERLKSKPTEELLSTPTLENRIELQRRISPAISILLLVICAPLLVNFNPRENRYGKFAIAILIYALYANSQYILQSLIINGKLPAFPGIYIVHIAFIICIIAWISLKNIGISARSTRLTPHSSVD